MSWFGRRSLFNNGFLGVPDWFVRFSMPEEDSFLEKTRFIGP
jgi:hypothetical protein